jgi:hypothetical protein
MDLERAKRFGDPQPVMMGEYSVPSGVTKRRQLAH